MKTLKLTIEEFENLRFILKETEENLSYTQKEIDHLRKTISKKTRDSTMYKDEKVTEIQNEDIEILEYIVEDWRQEYAMTDNTKREGAYNRLINMQYVYNIKDKLNKTKYE